MYGGQVSWNDVGESWLLRAAATAQEQDLPKSVVVSPVEPPTWCKCHGIYDFFLVLVLVVSLVFKCFVFYLIMMKLLNAGVPQDEA